VAASTTREHLERLERIVGDLDGDVRFDAPIGPTMTWYRIGGNADVLVEPRSVKALETLVRRCRGSNVPLRVLGSGANLLVDDEGVDGVVVHLSNPLYREVSATHRHRRHRGGDGRAGDGLRIMAGASMERLVVNQAMQGMRGLEMMAGIPASLGGAIRMNAGGRYGSIADAVTEVGCLDINGRQVAYPRESIEFGYRRCSIIDPVILWAEVRLTPDDPKRVHDRVKEIFAFKKNSQPMGAKSAGCAFKNPAAAPGDASSRVSAGMLIDQAGLKGFTVGRAHVSDVHANFIAAEPGARAKDIIEIMRHAQRVVREASGYELQPEIVIWKRGNAAPSSVPPRGGTTGG